MRGNIKFLLLFSVFSLKVVFAQADTSLSFTEIMFNPQSGNNEFIEIYNLSETESIDLNGYKIIYSTSNADIITSAGFGTLLQPNSFAVIFEGDYDFVSGIYNNLIPQNALILKISDNSFGTSGMANTADRQLWLLRPNNDTLETYTYSANNSTAFSDEKITLNKNNSGSNWANSFNTNGTPGGRNSVTPLNNDLEFSSLLINPAVPISGDNIQVTGKIKNRGINTALSYSVEIYNDLNFDSTGSPEELIFSQSLNNLLPGDSITVNTIINSANKGNYQLIGKVLFSEDEDTLNNKRIIQFTVYPPGNEYNDVVINEIMYAPSTGEPEWIELYNRTESPVNLKGWEFSDNSTNVTITTNDKIIESGSFIVLSKDSSILNFYTVPVEIIVLNLPALNNTGDAVVIKDSLGILLDSLSYFPDWGGNSGGRSLERISVNDNSNLQSNWGTSVSINKATPGIINSLTPKDFDIKISSFKTENNFGILGEEIKFTIQVNNPGLNNSNNFLLKIFNDISADSIPQQSEQIGEISGTSILSGDSSQFNFQTSDFAERNNYFIAYVEMNSDQDTTNNIAFTKVIGVTVNEVRNDLIINEFMYAPTSPEPEWIEIYNRSDKIVSIKNYSIADNNDTVLVIEDSILLNPKEYFVIAADSSVHNFYNVLSGIAYKNFSALNNTGDKIILLDSLNRTIDSLQYSSSWGGSDGKSLERINSEISSTDSTNWKTSASRYKGTPGYINSVTEKDFDLELSNIIYSPPLPVFGENVSVSVKVKNIGRNTGQFSIQLYDDTDLDSISDQLVSEITSLTLLPGDSSVNPMNYSIQNLQSIKGFYALINFIPDEDTSNNYFYSIIKPGYPASTIVINEIMFTPSGGEPEWVEIFNKSGDSINIKNWSVTDVFTTPASGSVEKNIYIEPGSYLLLAKDSSVLNYHRLIPSQIVILNLPVLNNDIDGVVLKDDRGAAIDSVLYSSAWGETNGYSLERKGINIQSNLSGNWGSSVDIEQSTPGRINSITPKQYDLSVAEISFDPRFPVAGENVFISAKIKNNGSLPADNFSVEFYFDSDSNNVIYQLLERITGLNLQQADSLSIQTSNSLQNLQNKILTAVRIVFVNDEDTLNNYAEKSVQPGFSPNLVLINEVMYDPKDNEPEWFEIVNVGADSVNIKNWAVSDILSTPTKSFLATDDLFIHPGEFVIISKDTSIYNIHPDLIAKVIIANFGTLSSTTDGIIIYDFRDGIIDSLMYKSSWGGKNGYSLERISLSAATNDSSNWVTSLSDKRSTPGKENSIASVGDYERDQLVINEIMFDPDIDNSEFIEFFNGSDSEINIGGWLIEDENKNLFKLSDSSFTLLPNSYFLLISDSSTLQRYNLNNYRNKTIVGTSSLSLVNTGELILLKDAKRNIIDSIWYSDKWHNKNILNTKNRSLERINPGLNGNDQFNWSTSVSSDGATPGKQNSIFTDNLNKEAKISVSPNPFSPDNDGFEDFTLINYNITQTTAQVRLKIFDSKGRLVRTLINNQASASSGSIIFDGLDDEGRALRIGIYIIFMEALNDNSGVVETLKTTVVVARKLN
ncbi:MAG: lamin tail domain-containing protein [Ignavibacteria bacterium]|nr:lamin tail domain-containing protein [Ignavibacteria bacterium]